MRHTDWMIDTVARRIRRAMCDPWAASRASAVAVYHDVNAYAFPF